MTNYNFSSKFKPANILSIILFLLSVFFIFFKGLNYGIDFKGGTLIELRSINTDVSSIRSSLNDMSLGDVNVKKFGKEGDFLIKISPGFPFAIISLAFNIFILQPLNLNQVPGVGCSAFIFAIMLLALSFQLILVSDFSTLLA